MTGQIPYLQRRGQSRVYRRIIPPDVREKMEKPGEPSPWEWRKTFRKNLKDWQVVRECERLAREHDRAIALARGEELSPEDIEEAEAQARPHLGSAGERARAAEFWAHESDDGRIPGYSAAVLSALEHGGKVRIDRLPLSKVYDEDKANNGHDKNGKPSRREEPFTTAVDSFIAEMGDLDIRQIRYRDVEAWIRIVSRERKDSTGEKVKAWKNSTVERRRNALHSIVERAYRSHEIERKNPFSGHAIEGGGGRADDRLPFSRAMLKRIDDHLASNKLLGPDTRNILKLMKLTGAGPGELGGIVLADAFLDAPIPYFWIRPNALRVSLKNEEFRPRHIPLVGEALEAAQDAVRRARVRSKGKSPDTVGVFKSYTGKSKANGISAKINKAIRAAGIPESPRLVAYSYRHTLKEAMRQAKVDAHVQNRLMGHTLKGTEGGYGTTLEMLPNLRDAINAAIPFLGNVDEAIYAPHERLKPIKR